MAYTIRIMAVLLSIACLCVLVNRETTVHSQPIARSSSPAADAKSGVDASKLPGPRKEYTPAQVVQVVMDALQNNDETDSGIATVFNFASPENKKLTGPLARFIPMVKSPAYVPMLNFKSVEFGEVKTEEDHSEMLVTITVANGDVVQYVFEMGKQKEGEFKDCWMTEGVLRVQPKGKPA